MLTELRKLRTYLANQPRDLLLFELALQTQVPVKKLLELKVQDVKDLEIGDELPLVIPDGENSGAPKINANIFAALNELFKHNTIHDHDYLFKSRKGDQPLSIPSVSRIIRKWMNETGTGHLGGLPGLRQAQRNAQKQEQRPKNQNIAQQHNLPQVKSRTVQETVFQELENAILSGKIRPGQKIVTEKIARMMNVSRIPVREAMGRLEAKGLISIKPKWGSMVNELSREKLIEISEMRLLLEPKAAAKATKRVDNRFLALLTEAQSAFADARRTANTTELLNTNRKFHFLIYRQADSPILLDVITQMWDKVSPYYHIMFNQSLLKSPTIGLHYHEHIVQSIKEKNEKEVRRWLKADLTDSTNFILQLFDSTALQKDDV